MVIIHNDDNFMLYFHGHYGIERNTSGYELCSEMLESDVGTENGSALMREDFP